jgi:OOP family OmpA-OmpF porin
MFKPKALLSVSAVVIGLVATPAFAQQGKGTAGYVTDTRNAISDPSTLLADRLLDAGDRKLRVRRGSDPATSASRRRRPGGPAAAGCEASAAPAAEAVTRRSPRDRRAVDFDKAVLKPEGQAKLDDLVAKLKGVALEVIIAIGQTDRIGGDAYNQKLSVRRAEAIKAYLVSKGIEPSRIYTEGKGKTQPVKQCPNPGPKSEIKNRTQLIACLQPNRRVEVEVVGTQSK